MSDHPDPWKDTMSLEDRIQALIGQDALDTSGRAVGRVTAVYLDERTDAPKWVLIQSDDRAGDPTVAPLRDPALTESIAELSATREQTLSAPRVADVGDRLGPEQERELELHYGRRPEVGDGQVGSPEMVRSEEELTFTTQAVARERVRLVKRIVTDTVTRTVEVRREELHIERLPADPAAAENETETETGTGTGPGPGPTATTPPARLRAGLSSLQQRIRPRGGEVSVGSPFAEDEREIVLYEEEVVVTKRIVPRERIRLRREAVVEHREVQAQARSERVELVTDHDDHGRPVA